MNTESVVIAVLMFSVSVYSALMLNDVFLPIAFWVLGVVISIVGLIKGE